MKTGKEMRCRRRERAREMRMSLKMMEGRSKYWIYGGNMEEGGEEEHLGYDLSEGGVHGQRRGEGDGEMGGKNAGIPKWYVTVGQDTLETGYYRGHIMETH